MFAFGSSRPFQWKKAAAEAAAFIAMTLEHLAAGVPASPLVLAIPTRVSVHSPSLTRG
jgi:hypothetical protein